MSLLKTIELTCPNCDRRFTSTSLDSPAGPGRQRTDFHTQRNDARPLTHGVHVCACCGFAGPEQWFTDGEVSSAVCRHVWDELAPRVARGPLPASERYEFAAKVASWGGATPREVAELWLRAAWCCVDEGDTEAERFYRRHAVWGLEESLEQYDGVPRQDRAVVTYLVGELWRRIGDEKLAHEWFDRVEDEVVDKREQAWVVQIARQQRTKPRDWFA